MTRLWVVSIVAAVSAYTAGSESLAAQERDTLTLDTITVTSRVPRPAIATPIATARSEGPHSASSLLGLSDLASVPGLSIEDRFNSAQGDRVSIRGFGARTQFGIRGIRVLVDGIPATLADGQTTLDHLDLSTVASVEVARGLSSAQYGNSAGGVLSIGTDPGGLRGLEMVGGGDGYRRARLGYEGQLSRSTTAEVGGGYVNYDGFREHSESDRYFASGRFGHRSGNSELSVNAALVDFTALNPGGLDLATREATPDAAAGSSLSNNARKDATQAQVGASLLNAIGSAELRSSAYGIRRDLFNPIPGRVIDLERWAGGLQSFLSVDPTPCLQVLIGGSLDLQSDNRSNFANNAGEAGTLMLDQHERVTNTAGFLRAFWEPIRRLTVMGSLRMDRTNFTVDDRFLSDGDDGGSRTMSGVSPGLGVNFILVPGWSVYSSVGTGFETPTTTELTNQPNGNAGLNPALDPQRATSLEGGLRGVLVQRVLFSVAAYRTPVRDALVPFEAESSGRTFFRNAGRSMHRGIELSARAFVTPSVSLDAAYSLMDVQYVDFTVGGDVFDGNDIPGTARHTFSANAVYELQAVWFRAGARSRSEVFVNDANSATSPGWLTAEVSSGLSGSIGGAELSGFVTISNLFDVDYDSAVTVNAFGGRFYEPGPGRRLTIGMSVKVGEGR